MPLSVDTKIRLVNDWDSAQELMSWLSRGQRTHVAVDTETTGLIIGRDRVRLVQVGWTDAGFAIPWERWGGLLEEVVRRFPGRLVMHNAKVDTGMLDHEGLVIPRHRVDDTRIMAHIIEPNMATGLKPQAARHVDPAAVAAQARLDEAINARGAGWTWATIPITYKNYWVYAAMDTVLTAHLFEKHWPAVHASFLRSYELENAVQWVIQRMERYGAHVDVQYASEAMNTFERDCNQIERECVDEYHIRPGSNIAVVRKLEEFGFTFTKETKSGAQALDKEVLGSIDHPLAQMVLRRRQRQKLASTYLRHFATEYDTHELIHPSINTLGARTSRMSMERPNLQNLPRKSESNRDAETIRNCITTRDDGDGTLVMCDFDQIEMRLLAHMSQDPGLIEAFHSPDDFFVELARRIFQDPNLTKKDPRRSITKNVGYAQIYVAGLAKMALTAGVPESQVKVVKQQFDAIYPNVSRFQKEVEIRAWQRQRDEGVPY